MSSINDRDPMDGSLKASLEARLRRFYSRRIIPLEVPPTQEGRRRVSSDSFWIERDGSTPQREDFEVRLRDDLDMALTLELFWENTVLYGLGTPLARLARRFPRTEKEEVSSFVYEMF